MKKNENCVCLLCLDSVVTVCYFSQDFGLLFMMFIVAWFAYFILLPLILLDFSILHLIFSSKSQVLALPSSLHLTSPHLTSPGSSTKSHHTSYMIGGRAHPTFYALTPPSLPSTVSSPLRLPKNYHSHNPRKATPIRGYTRLETASVRVMCQFFFGDIVLLF